MKFGWGKEKIRGYRNPVRKAEESNEWDWWALFVAVVIMVILFILKILGKI